MSRGCKAIQFPQSSHVFIIPGSQGKDKAPSMRFDPERVLIFCENFDPSQISYFDFELDEIIRTHVMDKRVIKGFCNISGARTEFAITSDNLRENVVSKDSNSINRHRQLVCGLSVALFDNPHASLSAIAQHINEHRLKTYLADANSVLFQFFKQNLNPELFVYSEYFGPQYQSGAVINGIRHEDLQRTSFADETFDLIITLEVFEHIPDALIAEKEVIRVLKKKGIYCFTVPFIPYHEHDQVRAELDENGNLKHLLEPAYHGDPLRPEEGILVFRVFSFNDLKRRFEDLGSQFKTYRFWSKSLGILGSDCWVHVVSKPRSQVDS